jgi:mannosyltransferase PIG-V
VSPASRRGIIAAVWLAWAAAVLVYAATIARSPAGRLPPWPADPEGTFQRVPLSRWDAGWYFLIARDGYSYDPAIPQNTIGFYPLYPLLLRATVAVFPLEIVEAGVVLSLLFLLGGLLVVSELAAEWGEPASGLATPGALLAFPTAFFFASIYTESLFLFATASALFACHRGRWILAGICGAAAAATRPNGLLILLPIAMYAWRPSSGARPAGVGRRFAAVALAAAGAAAYPIFLGLRFGDPLLYWTEKTSPSWPVRPGSPLSLVRRTAAEVWWRVSEPSEGDLLYLSGVVIFLGFCALAVLLFRRGRHAEGLYVAANLLMLAVTGTLDGVQRYVIPLFPAYFVLGEMLRRRPVVALAYLAVGLALSLVWLDRFVRLLPVA